MLHHTDDLFPAAPDMRHEMLGAGAWLLRGFALSVMEPVLAAIEQIAIQAPYRHMQTPGGFRMSVAMTNCGSLGWVSDRRGYRYARRDPDSDRAWPPLPEVFLELARAAATAGGFTRFLPDACLVNRYAPGARLTLHQDKDERDFDAPIVSVSLGLSAVFLFGGRQRTDPQRRIPVHHGDVIVWGGAARLNHHGVLPLKAGEHPTLGSQRMNLTFRRAG